MMANGDASFPPFAFEHSSWPETEVNLKPSPAEVVVTVSSWLNTSLGDNVSDSVLNPREDTELRLWVLVMLVFPLLTCWGNILVVMAVYREKALRNATNYFIVSLAVADIMVGLLVMPGAVYVEAAGEWLLGDVVCDMWVAFDVLCCTASIINLAAISVDRYIAVTRPIQYAKHQNSRRIYVTIALTWVVSVALSSPIALGVNYTDKRVQHECTFYNSDFLIYSSMGSFYIPTFIMVLLYWRIFAAIRQRARQARKQRLLQERRAQGSAATAASSMTCESLTALHASDSVRRNYQQQQRSNAVASSATSLDVDRRRPNSVMGVSVSAAPHHTSKRSSQDSAVVVVMNGGARLSDRSGGDVIRDSAAEKVDDLDDLLDDDDDAMQPSSHDLWTRNVTGDNAVSVKVGVSTNPFLQSTKQQQPKDTLRSTPAAALANDTADKKLTVGVETVYVSSTASANAAATAATAAGEKTTLSIAQDSGNANGRRNTYCGGGGAAKLLLPLNNGQQSARSSLSSQVDWSPVTPKTRGSSFSFHLHRHRRGSCASKEHDPNLPHYQQQTSQASSHGSRHEKLAHKHEKKATKTLAIVLGVYLFCWAPFFTINIMNAICIRYSLKDTRPECQLDPMLFSFFVWLGYINSFLNPIIYTIFNVDFRRAFKNILQKPCAR